MSDLTDHWLESYKRARGVAYKGFGKRDAVILAKLSKEYGEATVRALIGKFLKLEDEPYVRRAGWDTRAFASRIRGLYVDHVRQYGERAVQEANEKREALKRAPAQVMSLVDRIGRTR